MTETNILLKASDRTKSSTNKLPKQSAVEKLQGHIATLQSILDDPATAEHFKVKYRAIHDRAKQALENARSQSPANTPTPKNVSAPAAAPTAPDVHKEHSRQLLELVRLRTTVKDPEMHQRIDEAIKTHLANKPIK